jgi:RNA:NAD 2'-phosphotransferase (TPT1/KptA family)
MNQTDNISRFFSLVLRHQPGNIGLKLDEAGCAGIDDLPAKYIENE